MTSMGARLTKVEARMDALDVPLTGRLPFDLERWKAACQETFGFWRRYLELAEKYPAQAARLHTRFLVIWQHRRDERFGAEVETSNGLADGLRRMRERQDARLAAVYRQQGYQQTGLAGG